LEAEIKKQLQLLIADALTLKSRHRGVIVMSSWCYFCRNKWEL